LSPRRFTRQPCAQQQVGKARVVTRGIVTLIGREL
jgi:hypothetical protein